MAHYVYILKDDTRLNWSKVGISKDCEKRVKSMRTAAPSLELCASYSVPDETIARRIERCTHDSLSYFYTKQREWFKCDPEVAQKTLEGIIEEVMGEE